MSKAPKMATTHKKKAASVPDMSYSRKVQVVHEVVNIPKVIHSRVPNLAWQLGQIGSQVGTQVGPQGGPKLATVNHPNVGQTGRVNLNGRLFFSLTTRLLLHLAAYAVILVVFFSVCWISNLLVYLPSRDSTC